jgi:transposase InsO family protein
MKAHAFAEAEKAAGHSVKRCCELLEVSRGALDERLDPTPSVKQRSDLELTAKITAVHTESKGTYESPRVHQELNKRGVECGTRRVRRLMRQSGLEGRCKKRRRKTTTPDSAAEAALDLIQRAFGPGPRSTAATSATSPIYRYLGGMGVSGHRHRSVVAPSRRVGAGQPHAHRAGRRRADHGTSEPWPGQRAHLPLRPRMSRRIPVVVATPR